jgi:hypothetical protein
LEVPDLKESNWGLGVKKGILRKNLVVRYCKRINIPKYRRTPIGSYRPMKKWEREREVQIENKWFLKRFGRYKFSLHWILFKSGFASSLRILTNLLWKPCALWFDDDCFSEIFLI